jgi:TolB-like protein
MAELAEDRRQGIRDQLERILSSAAFSGSERHRQFLRYVVEQALKGDTDKLNEFVLGFEVFNKGESFDPRIDSIVRVEARRLRERLKRYYEEEGRGDPIVITLRPRSFVPAFEDAAAAHAPAGARLRAWLPSHKTVVVAVVALLCGAVGMAVFLRSRWGRPPRPPMASVVVLPFQQITPAPSQEWLGDGIADAVITGLAGIPGLRVISRGSGIQFQQSGQSPVQAAADLKVDYIVEGTVQVRGDRVLVSAKMTDTHSQSYVWAQTLEKEMAALADLEREITGAIASRIRVPQPPGMRDRIARRRPANGQAYGAFLKGQYYWFQWEDGGVEKSIALFEEALRGDPNYAPAWAWLSQGYHVQILREDGQNAAAISKGRQAAQKALALDDRSAEAHAAVASYAALDWDWSTAEREFRRAIELNPEWAHGHLMYATLCLLPTGRLREATAEVFRAHEIDPLSRFTRTMLAEVMYLSRDYARAMVEYEDLRKPANTPANSHYFLSLAFSGKEKEALAEFRRTISATGERWPGLAVLGYLEARYGDRQKALAIRRRLVEASRTQPLPPLAAAQISVGLGDLDDVFRQLRQAVARHSPSVPQVVADPVFDPLRKDARFAEILRDLGISPSPSLSR